MSLELKIKLQEARRKLAMSQSQFAAFLGVPTQTLQSWEIDRRTPRGFALKALEEKLDQILSNQ